MTESWLASQQSHGASIEKGIVQHFGALDSEINAINTESGISDLGFYRIVSVTGSDAEAFLHGQFSNDVKLLTENNSQLSSYNNPKGRVLALFRIWKQADSFFLRMPMEVVEATLKRLQMFVMRSDVKLALTNLLCTGIAGPDAPNLLTKITGSDIPQQPDGCIQAENMTVCRLPGNTSRFEIYASEAETERLWSTARSHTTPTGYQAWQWLAIEEGQADIVNATREAFVAQMLNLEPLNAISFTKGCYPGQEIVARMHYLGSLKRRMYHLRCSSNAPAEPGDEVFVLQDNTPQAIGKLVNIVSDGKGGMDMLAVLQIQNAETGNPLCLDQDGEQVVEIKPLPYEFGQTRRQTK